MNFRDIVTPKKLNFDQKTLTENYGKFVAEPFETGYGHTIGNSIRRILLSSLEGAAVIAIKSKSVVHEFSVIKGVVEDTMQIILNLKQINFKMYSSNQEIIYLKAKGQGVITANDLEMSSNIEVINKDAHIATLEVNGELDMEIIIAKGRGYMSSEKIKEKDIPLNAVAIDAAFTPVIRVNYSVDNARVGNITDYDKLIMEIWTNGSVKPEDALAYSSKILKDSVNVFINFEEEEEEKVEEIDNTKAELLEKEKKFAQMLKQPVDVIELSVRSSNCLRNAKIKTIGDLVTKREEELINYKNFGKKSLDEIKEKLVELNLSLGMEVDKEIE